MDQALWGKALIQGAPGAALCSIYPQRESQRRLYPKGSQCWPGCSPHLIQAIDWCWDKIIPALLPGAGSGAAPVTSRTGPRVSQSPAQAFLVWEGFIWLRASRAIVRPCHFPTAPINLPQLPLGRGKGCLGMQFLSWGAPTPSQCYLRPFMCSHVTWSYNLATSLSHLPSSPPLVLETQKFYNPCGAPAPSRSESVHDRETCSESVTGRAWG